MLESPIQSALNEQLNIEQASAHAYLAMAAWFEQRNFGGFASFMRSQFEEETQHAMKIFDYIVQRGGEIKLKTIAEPKLHFDSPKEVFEAALGYEQENTKSINALFGLLLVSTMTMQHKQRSNGSLQNRSKKKNGLKKQSGF